MLFRFPVFVIVFFNHVRIYISNNCQFLIVYHHLYLGIDTIGKEKWRPVSNAEEEKMPGQENNQAVREMVYGVLDYLYSV